MRVICLLLFLLFAPRSQNCFAQDHDSFERLSRLQELLESDEIRAELDLDKSQLSELKRVFTGIRADWRGLSFAHHNAQLADDKKGVEDARKSLEERYESAITDLKGIILPHQLLRLSQIETQNSLSTLSDCSFGILHLCDDLQLTDIQKTELEKIIHANNQEFAKLLARQRQEIIDTRNRMQADLTRALNEEQSKKFNDKIGKEFFDCLWLSRWFNKGEFFERNFQKK